MTVALDRETAQGTGPGLQAFSGAFLLFSSHGGSLGLIKDLLAARATDYSILSELSKVAPLVVR